MSVDEHGRRWMQEAWDYSVEMAREAFSAGVDAGIEWADEHHPDDGHGIPTQEERDAWFAKYQGRAP